MLLIALYGFAVTEVTPTELFFTATAYSLRGKTASGKPTRRGIIAADTRILPLGTKVKIEHPTVGGTYIVADTGSAIINRRIDIWMPNRKDAINFGRQKVKLKIIK